MAEKKEYRSSIRSRQMIRKAFMELLQEKEYPKITVTDIVRRADLNRSTFYAHYPDIRGVVEEIQSEIFQHDILAVEKLDIEAFTNNPTPFLQEITNLLGENVELFKKLGHTEELHVRLDDFRRLLVDRLRSDERIPQNVRESAAFSIRVYFFIGGMMNTYQQWAEGVLDCTLEEISEEIGRLITQSSSEILSQIQ